jgi:hypothetical protein
MPKLRATFAKPADRHKYDTAVHASATGTKRQSACCSAAHALRLSATAITTATNTAAAATASRSGRNDRSVAAIYASVMRVKASPVATRPGGPP